MFGKLNFIFVITLLNKECYCQLDVCGKAPLNTRIVGGADAPVGAWPWQASIHKSSRYFCGGSLINSEWILSAAHCFETVSAPGITVYLGRKSQQQPNSNEVSRNVSRIIIHPDYNGALYRDNNMALLQLSSPVNFSTFIRPVCLAAEGSTFNNGSMMWVTGWGTVDDSGSLPQNLQEVNLPVGIDSGNCTGHYASMGLTFITDNMMCAGQLEGGTGPCQGDAGSPLVIKQGSTWIQGGVACFTTCAAPNFPGVYSRVSKYQTWITEHTGGNKPGFIRVNSIFTDYVQNVTFTTPAPRTNFTDYVQTVTFTTPVCGKAPLNTRIVGGADAPVGAWPWQASIHKSSGYFCGGSLINSEWILSAAHCFETVSAPGITVYLGRKSQQQPNPNEVSRNVSRIIIHPDYNGVFSRDNNMALLQLSSPVNFSTFITPVCLAAEGSTFNNGSMMWVTGWGTVDDSGSLPQNLQEVNLPVGIDSGNCTGHYASMGLTFITDNMMCAGQLEGGTGPCQGDAGSPLVIKQGSTWIQGGVTCFTTCAAPNFPGVYSRVSKYQTWITEHTGGNKPGFIRVKSSFTDYVQNVTFTTPDYVQNVTFTTPAVSCDSSAGLWKWMASIRRDGSHVCGGTLIFSRYVMTSADCFSSSTDPSGLTVVIGQAPLGCFPIQVVTLSVAKIDFSDSMALLTLPFVPELLVYDSTVVVDMYNLNYGSGFECLVFGWSSGGSTSGPFPQEFQTTIVNCNSSINPEINICTEPLVLQQDDKGSPLLCQYGGIWYHTGLVTSASFSNNMASGVQVFTKISPYSSFLSDFLTEFPSIVDRADSSSPLSLTWILLLSLPALLQAFN